MNVQVSTALNISMQQNVTVLDRVARFLGGAGQTHATRHSATSLGLSNTPRVSRLDFWPKIDHSYIYLILKQKSPVKQNVERGYKFYSESYTHLTENKCNSSPVINRVNQLKTRDIDS